MSKPGPKPRPTALKELQGNPGRRPLPKNEPALPSRAPRKPRGLKGRHEAAAKLYDEVARFLGETGISTALDSPAFRLMAAHYGLAMEAQAVLVQEGLMTVDERGLPRKHPMNQVFRDHSAAFLRYAAEFGMTPSSRTRIYAPTDDEGVSLVELLFGIE